MYRSENFGSERSSPTVDGHALWQSSGSRVPPPLDVQTLDAMWARSPLEAMQMAEGSEPCELFPTVTITLTTIFWPGTAH
jgi:hypothetical protein